MSCLKPGVIIAPLKLPASPTFGLVMCKLKSPFVTILGSSTILSVSHSANFPKKSRMEPDGGLCNNIEIEDDAFVLYIFIIYI